MWNTFTRLFAKSKLTEEGEEAAEEETSLEDEEKIRKDKRQRENKKNSRKVRSSIAALSATRVCYENGVPVADVAAVHVFVPMERNMGDDRRKGNVGAHGDQQQLQIGAAGDAEHFSDAYDTRLVSHYSPFINCSMFYRLAHL